MSRGRALELLAGLAFFGWALWIGAQAVAANPSYAVWPQALSLAAASCFEPPHAYIFDNLIHAARGLFAFALLIAVVWVWGGALARRWLADLDPIERRLGRLGLGACVLHALMFLLGVFQLWHVEVLRAFVIVTLVVDPILERRRARRAPKKLSSATPPAQMLRAQPFLWLALAWIGLAALESLTPEIGADAGMYHVGVPNTWLLDHGIHLIPDHYASNLPLPQSMFYGLLLALGPSDGTRLFQPALLALGALALFRLCSLYTSARHFPLEVWALLAVPALNGYLAISGNDQLIIAFTALGLLFLARASQAERPERASKALFASACFLGLAMAGKYTDWPYAALIAILAALIWRVRRLPPAPLPIAAALLLFPSGLWAVKNVVLTGNPVYPLLTSLFGSKGVYMPGLERALATNVSNVESLSDLLQFPITASLQPGPLMHAPGPHWLLLAPLVLLAVLLGREKRNALVVAGFLLAGWLLWALLYTNARYSGPLFAATGVAFSVALNRVADRLGPTRLAWSCAIAVLLMWITASGWAYRVELTRPYTYLCGRYDQVGYAVDQPLGMTMAPPHALIAELNKRLDPGRHRVLLVGESRSAGLDVPYVSGCEYDRPAFERYVLGARDLDAVVRRLEADGITHIALNLAAGAMFERYSFHMLTLDPASQTLWSELFTSRVQLLTRELGRGQDWAIVELLPTGVHPSAPVRDLVGEALHPVESASP